jgi:hypothetical protein
MTAKVTTQGTIAFTGGGEGCVLTLQWTKDGADVGAAFQVNVASGVAIIPPREETGVAGSHVYGVRIVSKTCTTCTGATTGTVAFTNNCP